MREEYVIWQCVGLALTYDDTRPWPYELVMDESAESTCMLDKDELASLRDALIKHLDQL